MSWKEKVADKLSRLLSDSPSPSNSPRGSPVVQPEPQVKPFHTEDASDSPTYISSFFKSLLPSASFDATKSNLRLKEIKPVRSLPSRWKMPSFSWNDAPLDCQEEFIGVSERKGMPIVCEEDEDYASGGDVNGFHKNEQATSVHVPVIPVPNLMDAPLDCQGESKFVSESKEIPKVCEEDENHASGRDIIGFHKNEEATSAHVPVNPVPKLMDKSSFISAELFEFFEASLPNIVKGCQWALLYSMTKHGLSLRTLIRKSADLPGPCLLIVGDMQGAVFGGLLECPLKPTTTKKYQGTNQTFVFTTIYGQPRLFRATGANRYFYLCSDDLLALGGGGNFALCLDGDLLRGTSGPCETFGNLCLAHSPEFELKNVELWGFTHSSQYLNLRGG
ncbi:PREDICTED: nuclear receptor coactivator 7-like [Nelumbo nucifera]|uniref:TLDc domain-containing protein n=2 Tax=Nelumbo nucifera TaxID=4432 RepID=A0A822XK12_NELNU|nr:PREDICTED: nuclear receptor coactivator 7-like [Nelumbo nucifera]DAD20043.1 TPA_asm: hypothetical protein HUJ06_021506 [Nelumbo nucifera]